LAALNSQCAHYRELRSKPILTVVGSVRVSRPYLCPHYRQEQYPVEVKPDIKYTEFSPEVGRMCALVGQGTPFDHGREQMKVLAGLEVTAKSVERTAKAIGEDIAQRERDIDKAIQLDLPVVLGKPIPVLYVEKDKTGVPVVKQGNRRPPSEDGRSTGPCAGAQAGLCVHPSHPRQGRHPHPRSGFDYLHRSD
jgi:hypothetical protein